jgi:transcription elongation factor Elf1
MTTVNKTVKYPNITCNECGNNFKLKPKLVKKEEVAKGILRNYFICPHCKSKFVILYEDEEFQNNISKMNDIKNQRLVTVDKEQDDELIKQYHDLTKRNVEISQQYKRIYGR